MMTQWAGEVGSPSLLMEAKSASRRSAGIELFATLALAVALVIAATAVSIGIAQARPLGAVGYRACRHGAFAFLAGAGGLSAVAAHGPSCERC